MLLSPGMLRGRVYECEGERALQAVTCIKPVVLVACMQDGAVGLLGYNAGAGHHALARILGAERAKLVEQIRDLGLEVVVVRCSVDFEGSDVLIHPKEQTLHVLEAETDRSSQALHLGNLVL